MASVNLMCQNFICMGQIGKHLELLNEKRVDKVDRLKAAEKDRDGLADKKKVVEEVMERERQIRKRQNVIYQLHENTAMAKVKQFVVKRDDARASLEQERSKKKNGEEELVSLEKAYASKKAQYDAVKKELDDAQSVGTLRIHRSRYPANQTAPVSTSSSMLPRITLPPYLAEYLTEFRTIRISLLTNARTLSYRKTCVTQRLRLISSRYLRFCI
jgi:hypothetical protein